MCWFIMALSINSHSTDYSRSQDERVFLVLSVNLIRVPLSLTCLFMLLPHLLILSSHCHHPSLHLSFTPDSRPTSLTCPCSPVVKSLGRHVQYSVTFAVAGVRFEPQLGRVRPMHMMTREIIPGRNQRARRCPL